MLFIYQNKYSLIDIKHVNFEIRVSIFLHREKNKKKKSQKLILVLLGIFFFNQTFLFLIFSFNHFKSFYWKTPSFGGMIKSLNLKNSRVLAFKLVNSNIVL